MASLHRSARVKDVHQALAKSPSDTFFDLERSSDRQALAVAPAQTLSPLSGLVVLDEVQTMPELFQLERLFVVYPGARRFDLANKITALPFAEIPATVTPL